MPAKIDKQPALRSLLNLGWSYKWYLEDVEHNGALMEDPNGNEKRLQFRGRNAQPPAKPKYFFGVYCYQFSRLDYNVFFAHGERDMLVVPTDVLDGIFDESIAKIGDNDRWHVNIYFDIDGEAGVTPVNYGESYDLTQYKMRFAE